MGSVRAPLPPIGSYLSITKAGELQSVYSWGKKWRADAATVSIRLIDETGERVTVTRAVAIGLFAWKAKKKTGSIKVVLGTPAGETHIHEVPAKNAAGLLEWAARFELWQQAQQRAGEA